MALRESRDLAAKAGDLSLAFLAAGELAAGYAVDLPTMKLDLLKVTAKALTEPEDQRGLVRRIFTVVTEAAEQDQYEVAKAAGQLALDLANKTGPVDLITAARNQIKVVVAAAPGLLEGRPGFETAAKKTE